MNYSGPIILCVFLYLAPAFLTGSNAADTLKIKAELRQLDKQSYSWEQKETAARNLIKKSTSIGYTNGTLHAYYILATTYFFRQQYQRSFTVLDSLLIFLNSGGKDLPKGKTLEDKKARVYSFMGMIFDEIGDYDKAMEYYLKSLMTVEPYGDNYEKAVLYKNLGMTNIAVGNKEKSNQYFTKALTICKTIGDKKTVFDIYNALQRHYADSARYDTALQYGLKLLEIAREDSDGYSLALAYNALGNIYLASGHRTLAEGFLNEALDLSLKNQYETIAAQTMTGLASLKLSGLKLIEAKDLATRALEISERTGILNLKTQSAECLADVFEKMHDFNNALKYRVLFEQYKDEETRKKNARFVLEVQTRFEMDKIHQEKKLLEDQLIIQQYRVSRRNYLLFASLTGVLFLMVFIYFLVRRYKHVRNLNQQLHYQQEIINEQADRLHHEKEQVLNLEIEHKNRELTSIAMSLVQESEFKNHLIEELEKLKLVLGPSKRQEIKDINGIIVSIKQHISDNSWKEFRTYFDNVYSGFYANLDSEFPDLTQSEKKLCAMLKLGLNTKDISMLTYREVKSVESARNRLRKKMVLDPKTSLSLFLARF